MKTTGEEGAIGICSVMSRDVAKYPIMHRTASPPLPLLQQRALHSKMSIVQTLRNPIYTKESPETKHIKPQSRKMWILPPGPHSLTLKTFGSGSSALPQGRPGWRWDRGLGRMPWKPPKVGDFHSGHRDGALLVFCLMSVPLHMVKAVQTFASSFSGQVMGCDPEGGGVRLECSRRQYFPGPWSPSPRCCCCRIAPGWIPQFIRIYSSAALASRPVFCL